jgi:hypothetical protein
MEMGASRRYGVPSAPSQSLEFIADRHAVHGLTHWALTGRLGDYVQTAPGRRRSPCGSEIQRSSTTLRSDLGTPVGAINRLRTGESDASSFECPRV